MAGEEEEVTCGECHLRYAWGEKCPRSLFCSHTFCTSCLDQLIASGNRRCPACNRTFFSLKVTQIPTNFTLLRRATADTLSSSSLSSSSSPLDRLSTRATSVYPSQLRPPSLPSESPELQRSVTGSSPGVKSIKLPLIRQPSPLLSKYDLRPSSASSATKTTTYNSLQSKSRLSTIEDETTDSASTDRMSKKDVSSGDTSSVTLSSQTHTFPTIRSRLSASTLEDTREAIEKEVDEGMSTSRHDTLKQTTSLPLTTSAPGTPALNTSGAEDKGQSFAPSTMPRTSSESALMRTYPSTYHSLGGNTATKTSYSVSNLSQSSGVSRYDRYNLSDSKSSEVVNKPDMSPSSSSYSTRPSRSLPSLYKMDTKLPSFTSNVKKEDKLSEDEVDRGVLSWKLDTSFSSSTSPRSSDQRVKERASNTPNHVLKLCRSITSKSRPGSGETSNASGDNTSGSHSGIPDLSLGPMSTENDKRLSLESTAGDSRRLLNSGDISEEGPISTASLMSGDEAREPRPSTHHGEWEERKNDQYSEALPTATSSTEVAATTATHTLTFSSPISQNDTLQDVMKPSSPVFSLNEPDRSSAPHTNYATSSSPLATESYTKCRSSHPVKSRETVADNLTGERRELGYQSPQYRGLPTSSENPDGDNVAAELNKVQDDEKLSPTTSLGARLRARVSLHSVKLSEGDGELYPAKNSRSTEERDDMRGGFENDNNKENDAEYNLSSQSQSLGSRITPRTSYFSYKPLVNDNTGGSYYRSKGYVDTSEGEETKTEERTIGRIPLTSKWKRKWTPELSTSSVDQERGRITRSSIHDGSTTLEGRTARREWRLKRTPDLNTADANQVSDYSDSSIRAELDGTVPSDPKTNTSVYDEKEIERLRGKKREESNDENNTEVKPKASQTTDKEAESSPVIGRAGRGNPLSPQLPPPDSTGSAPERKQVSKQTRLRRYHSTDSNSKERLSRDENIDEQIRSPRMSSSRMSRSTFSLTDYHSMLLGRSPRRFEESDSDTQESHDRISSRSAERKGSSKSKSISSRHDTNNVSKDDRNSSQDSAYAHRHKVDEDKTEGSLGEASRYRTWRSTTSATKPLHEDGDSLDAQRRGKDSSTREGDRSSSPYSARHHSGQSETTSSTTTSSSTTTTTTTTTTSTSTITTTTSSRKGYASSTHRRVPYTELHGEVQTGSVSSIQIDEECDSVAEENMNKSGIQQKSKEETQSNDTYSNEAKEAAGKNTTPSMNKLQPAEINALGTSGGTTMGEDVPDGRRTSTHSKYPESVKAQDLVARTKLRLARLRERDATPPASRHTDTATATGTTAPPGGEEDKDRTESEATTRGGSKERKESRVASRHRWSRYRKYDEGSREEKARDPGWELRRVRAKLRDTLDTPPPWPQSKPPSPPSLKPPSPPSLKPPSPPSLKPPSPPSLKPPSPPSLKPPSPPSLKPPSPPSLKPPSPPSLKPPYPPSLKPPSPPSLKPDTPRSNLQGSGRDDTSVPSSSSYEQNIEPVKDESTQTGGDGRKDEARATPPSSDQDSSKSLIETQKDNSDNMAREQGGCISKMDESEVEFTFVVAQEDSESLGINHEIYEDSNQTREGETAAWESVNIPAPNISDQEVGDFLPSHLSEDCVDTADTWDDMSAHQLRANNLTDTIHYLEPLLGVGVCQTHRLLLHQYCTHCEEWVCNGCIQERHLPQYGCHVISGADAVSHMKLTHTAFLSSKVNTLESFREQLRKIMTKCDHSIRKHQGNMEHLTQRLRDEETLLQGIQSMKNLSLQKWQQVDYWEELLGENAEKIAQSTSSEEVLTAVQAATSTILARVMDGTTPHHPPAPPLHPPQARPLHHPQATPLHPSTRLYNS